MALYSSEQICELREVVLRNKPDHLIEMSAKATVPVLIDTDGSVIDESLEIMLWALRQNDPDNLLPLEDVTFAEVMAMIAKIDGPFKHHLDRYKYGSRYVVENEQNGVTPEGHRSAAMGILAELDERLKSRDFLLSDSRGFADIAIAPFVRQFANADRAWFDEQRWPNLHRWLSEFLASELFIACMEKYAPWESETVGVLFPATVN
jgi:glutathione S-transferase